MSYVADPVAEHAAASELAAAVAAYRNAGLNVSELVRQWLADGRVRVDVIAGVLGVSRRTVYRIAAGTKELGLP